MAIGGGHGLSMVLRAARSYARQVIGIVTVADDGGSSGRLTSALDIPPPGDMRRCLLALCPDDGVLQRVFAYRFTDTDVAGHSTGNLMLAALHQLTGDFETALNLAAEMLGAQGRIIPAARRSLHLTAVIDGTRVEGQAAVARHHGTVERLDLAPPAKANPHAIEAIEAADQIILGPGSLYTSVLSCLLVPGLVDAVDRAPGRLIYVMNLTTQDGETSGLTGADHLRELLAKSGLARGGDVLANRREFAAPAPVSALELDSTEVAGMGWNLVEADLVDEAADWPQHAHAALETALSRLV